ncbi:uncharacterized protein Dwil_GK27998 [Drosophila willistoni]|uniref:Uncharacterized protein n=1 Tax=Drosophila willistoni TaxID=7260 RepID=A0A0Q9WS58_DROWI|nr:uncharacterized protein LOC26530000 [Drosophila willistoni]KRF99114.1 uncharacterized protein Dwil_GK27998 [Drosophila willistoni]
MPLKLFIRFWLPLWLLQQQFRCLLAQSPQCFHFTWLGSLENHASIANESCESRVGDFNEIPCVSPLVVTPNDTVPDVEVLWNNMTENREQYLCQMAPGYSCVKYSYIFKGGIQNITYMCALVNSSNGCYKQTYSTGMQVEACVCTSKIGLIPCNGCSDRSQVNQLIGFLGLALFVFWLNK